MQESLRLLNVPLDKPLESPKSSKQVINVDNISRSLRRSR